MVVVKRKLKELRRGEAIAEGVDRVIREMQAAIIGAVAASFAATTAATASH